MSGRMSLTARSIDAIRPTDRRQYYYDSQVPCLELMVTPNSAKVFYFKYRSGGISGRVRIGPFPSVTPATARRRAADLAGQVAHGKDPAQPKPHRENDPTLGMAFSEYMSRHARPHKKSAEQDQGLYDRHVAAWSARKISTITRDEVQRLHARIGQTAGKIAANRVLALLSSLFGLLKTWGIFDGDNPAVGVKRFSEFPRERFLSKPEVSAFLQALDHEPDRTAADLLRILLYTGARKGSALAMRWDQIDRLDDDAVWTIPQSKNGQPVRVALPREAVAVLRQRESAPDADPLWVFPGSGASGHFGDLKRPFRRVSQRAGIQGATVHTLRHTVASWMTIDGCSLQIVGAALGHRSARATQRYAHLTIDPVRAATQSIATMMSAPPLANSGAMNPPD